MSSQPRDLKAPVRWGVSANFLAGLVRTILYAVKPDRMDPRDWMRAEVATEEADDGGAVRFDFVADTGDSGRGQATLARLVLSELDLKDREGHDHHLPRGRFLVFGGDTAYSIADAHNIRERLVGPWDEAYERVEDDGERRRVYAVPGNHDWYDKLDGFNRLFRKLATETDPDERPPPALAGYERGQDASYFAIRLVDGDGEPLDWEIHGVDTPEGDMDRRQAAFFAAHSTAPNRIVVTAASARSLDEDTDWYAADGFRTAEPVPYRFRREDEAEDDGLRLFLSGDTHHYAFYPGRDERECIVHCGMGSATLTPTHVHRVGSRRRRDPRPESNPYIQAEPNGTEQKRLEGARFFPSPADSPRHLSRWKMLFGIGTPVIGVLFGLLLGLGVVGSPGSDPHGRTLEVLGELGWNLLVVLAACGVFFAWVKLLPRWHWDWRDEHAARAVSRWKKNTSALAGVAIALAAGVLMAGAVPGAGSWADKVLRLGLELLWHLLAVGVVAGFVAFALSGRETRRHGPSKAALAALGLPTALLLVAAPVAGVAWIRGLGYAPGWQILAGAASGLVAWPLLFALFMAPAVALGAFPTVAGSFARNDDFVAFVRVRVDRGSVRGWVVVARVGDDPLDGPLDAWVEDTFELSSAAT